MMKRSKDVKLGLLAATAAVLGGCGADQHFHHDAYRRCVDQNQVVVDDRYCQSPQGSYPYRWYYGGPSGYVPMGQRVGGGSFEAPSSGTVRGVFGGTAAGEGAGE